MALASFLLIPVSAISITLSERIVAIVYARGAFGAAEVAMTGKALAYYSVGLAAMGFVGILSRAFASLLDTKTPVKIGVLGLLMNIILSLVLSRTYMAHGGVALATSAAFWFQAAVLWRILRAKIELSAEAERGLLMGILRIIATASITGVLTRYLAYRLQLVGTDGSTFELLQGFIGVAGCYAVVYLAISSALGVAESRRLIRAAAGYLGRDRS
jgi:putative peptidoglycan lipid II flippase